MAENLKKIDRGRAFDYLFDQYTALAEVLVLKTGLGIRVREAYRSRDMVRIENVAGECDTLLRLYRSFYEMFLRSWDTERKPQGFEAQDYRIGGMMRRAMHCRDSLRAFVRGEIASIPELETEMPNGHRGVFGWKQTASANDF